MSVNPIQEKTIYSDIQLFSYFFTPLNGERKFTPIYINLFIYIGVDLIPPPTQGNLFE